MKVSKRYLFIPIILLVFVLLFYFIYEDIKDRTINEFNTEQLILAETASQGITSFFNDFQSDLTFLSQFKEIIDFTDSSKALMSSFYNSHKDHIEAVTRVDAHGIILYTYPQNESVVGEDISNQKHVHQIISSHKPVISDVFTSVQGYLAIALHVPVFKGTEYIGSLAMLISIDKLGKQYLGKIKIRGTGNVWLHSENGIELFCPVSGHTGISFLDNTLHDSSSYELLANTGKENTGTARSIHQGLTDNEKNRFIEQYVTFCRVPLGNTYWTIIISYQKEDIYISLTRLRNRLILVFSILFIIILYYFYSLTKVRILLKEETIRKKAEKTLLESEEKFRRIFEDHTAVKLLIDPESGDIIDANKSAAVYYGWGREELKRMKISQINTLSPDELNKSIKKVIARDVNQFEFRHRRKDGSIRDIEVFSSKIVIGGKDILYSIVHDITERKQAKQELVIAKDKAEESDRLKSAFLANMSHEIRTPMNGILGFAGLLKEPGLNSEDQQKYIQIIEKSGARMLNIINDIVDISKIESGQMELSISETNTNKQIEFIYNFFKPEVEKRGIQFSFINSLPDNEAIIKTDREKIYAILSNLVKNAIKFTKKGFIEIGYNKIDDYLEFFVKDSGEGIPDEKQQIIFERFRQSSESITRNYEGAGLGLSIAKGYIEMLGGKIWVESEFGIGSVFHFTIPYTSENRPKPIMNDGSAEIATDNQFHPEISGLKILVVEDDESSEMFLFTVLNKYCKEIINARNGFESIEICRNNPDIDLVLMDIRMPEMDGYEATRQIREFNKECVIIAQTAFALSGDREKAIDAGCNDYIPKPIDIKLLKALIRKHFKN